MIRKQRSSPIIILSVAIVLMSLFLSVVGFSNSWFAVSMDSTDTSGIRVELNISSQLAWNVYQRTDSTDRKLGEDSYIELSGEIVPDTEYPVTLVLKEEDLSNNTAYLRYKIDFVTHNGTTISPVTINLQENEENLVKDDDGYYYYRSNSANAELPKGAELILMESFSIPLETFDSLQNSESIKIVLTVEASDTAF